MTTATPAAAPTAPAPDDDIRGREAGFFRDLVTVAGRALRQIPRDPESIIPAPASRRRYPSVKAARKRKVEQVETDDIDAELPVQPAKKAKVLEEKLKREKVRTRALVGVTATLAIA